MPQASWSACGGTCPFSTGIDPTVGGGARPTPYDQRRWRSNQVSRSRPNLYVAGHSITPPAPAPAGAAAVPMPADSLSYRLKQKLLGPPLHSTELEHQRLGKPTALAVFASDNLSSSAYATEEILHDAGARRRAPRLLPGDADHRRAAGDAGAAHPQLPRDDQGLPLCRRRLPRDRDNFGIVPAQVAGSALLVGYILTVAVSVSAGTAALVSQFEGLSSFRVPIALGFIAIVMYGNLRREGEREGVRRPHLLLHAQHGLLLAYGA